MMAWCRGIYVACIAYLSARTMLSATGMTDHHFWLAGIELVGALLFLVKATRRAGLVVLLVVYALVAVHDGLTGHVPTDLIIYGVAAAALR
jgi:hypothetical protein